LPARLTTPVYLKVLTVALHVILRLIEGAGHARDKGAFAMLKVAGMARSYPARLS